MQCTHTAARPTPLEGQHPVPSARRSCLTNTRHKRGESNQHLLCTACALQAVHAMQSFSRPPAASTWPCLLGESSCSAQIMKLHSPLPDGCLLQHTTQQPWHTSQCRVSKWWAGWGAGRGDSACVTTITTSFAACMRPAAMMHTVTRNTDCQGSVMGCAVVRPGPWAGRGADHQSPAKNRPCPPRRRPDTRAGSTLPAAATKGGCRPCKHGYSHVCTNPEGSRSCCMRSLLPPARGPASILPRRPAASKLPAQSCSQTPGQVQAGGMLQTSFDASPRELGGGQCH